MTQEDKELLLKDICARLNTKLVCSIYRMDDQGIGYRNEILYGYCNIDGQNEFYFGEDCGISINDISKIKPYLFPLESMTEEQEKEFNDLNCYELDIFPHTEKALDYVIKNHFDYRFLIDEGLAIDATGLNIY